MRKQQANSAALYSRLSRDDGGEAESNSISTQRSMLQRYAKEHGFTVYDEYVDDGWSGTQFDRPELKRMLADVEEGKIGVILCKDLSRFGRNNALVAYYTEIVFPDNDVRFIAVNDAIDTAMGDYGGNAVMPFMSVVNEYYARDISKKVRSARRTMALNGRHCSGRTPFGYLKDPDDSHKLVIDEETAGIVHRIFEMRADGLGRYEITNRLAADKVKTPSAYEFERAGRSGKGYDPDFPWDWSARTIDGILHNQAYLGHLVSGKQKTKSFKNHTIVNVPEDEWIIVKDTHTPIVSREVFDRVAAIQKVKRRENTSGEENIFAGLLVCSDCDKRLTFNHSSKGKGRCKSISFYCGTYRHGRNRGEFRKCSPHYISWNNLYSLVSTYVRLALSATLDTDALVRSLCDEAVNDDSDRKSADRLRRREGELKLLTRKAFEQNALGRIDDSTFTELYGGYQAEQKTIVEKLRELDEKSCMTRDIKANVQRFTDAVVKYTDAKELSRELLLDLIEKIVVHEATGSRGANRAQEVEIYFKFIGCLPE